MPRGFSQTLCIARGLSYAPLEVVGAPLSCLSNVTGGVSGGAAPTVHCEMMGCDPGGGSLCPGHRAVYEHASPVIILFYGEGAPPLGFARS
jgi:hypothetical protein